MVHGVVVSVDGKRLSSQDRLADKTRRRGLVHSSIGYRNLKIIFHDHFWRTAMTDTKTQRQIKRTKRQIGVWTAASDGDDPLI